MSAAREVIAALVAGGMDTIDAAALVARAAVEISPPADGRSPGAKRQAAWRGRNKPSQSVTARQPEPASQSVTARQPEPASQSVTERLGTSQSNASTNPPISTSKNSKESKRQNRGSRIASDWSLSDADRSFAKLEGFSDWEIQREAQKFRDYWTACAGSKGVKLDWSATWRQWIRSGAERAGKTPPSRPSEGGPSGFFYAKADSEQLAAWDAWTMKTTGKSLARDKNHGWNVKSEWPPDYVPVAKRAEPAPAPPLFRGMQ